jgi:hypothetical protein
MKGQHDTVSTGERTPLLTAGLRSRLRLALVALACALFGTACVTSTLITEVVHKEGGENLIGQSMTIEFNQGVWDALQDEDRTQLAGLFDSYKAKGWKVSSQNGGRIQTARFDPATQADLQTKGWTISVNAKQSGNVITAHWSPNANNSGSSSSGLQDITITIDESDPQATHYKYQATVLVKNQDSSGNTTNTQGDGSPFGFLIAQAVATAEADPRYSKLQQALKDAGPPKISVAVKLPGTIETTTINGSPGGDTSSNQVTWNITMSNNATYNLEATSSGASGGSNNPDAFGVSVACNPDSADDPGKVVCVANSANKPADAEIEFEWKFDGQVQEAKGNTLELHGVAKGEHSVSVVAIATNKNNLRSQPGGTTFTKTTGADAATTNATPAGGTFTVSVTCSPSDKALACFATPRGAPTDASLTYAWTINGQAVGATGTLATMPISGDGVYLVTVKMTDSKSGQSATASTTTPVGSFANPVGTIWDKIPDDLKLKINAGLTGSAAVTPPNPSDISAGAILGTLGSLAAAGAAALGVGGSVPANAPGTPANQQGQGGDAEKKKEDEQKGSQRGDFCAGEVTAMQSATSQARNLQGQLQQQRSQFNALQMQYEQTRQKMVVAGGLTLAYIPVAILEALAGAAASSAISGGFGLASGASTDWFAHGLADIRNQINGTQQYISDLEGQFSGAMQTMDNARSALNNCRTLHPGGTP